MIFGRVNASAAVARVLLAAIDGQHRYGRGLGVGWKISADVQNRAKRDVSQIRRGAVKTHDAIRQHGERVWGISKISPLSLNSNTATAIGMVHEHQLTPVGESFFERRKISRHGPEDLGVLFAVFRFWLFAHHGRMNAQRSN